MVFQTGHNLAVVIFSFLCSPIKMKMPASVGTKKAKAVEQLLEELGVGMSCLYCLKYYCIISPLLYFAILWSHLFLLDVVILNTIIFYDQKLQFDQITFSK